ncbi:MAG: alginate lyase family protein [candidate division KSB1 bacterium]|nr:alginate lyase family protein [candidate division KSB1 bacterium]
MKKLKSSTIHRMSHLVLLTAIFLSVSRCAQKDRENQHGKYALLYKKVVRMDSVRVITQATSYLNESPIPIVDSYCDRSLGGRNDFYSEGDYWWPNPEDPDGPYIRRDGMSNPDNFKDHRKAMRRFSQHVGTLVAAFRISGDSRYAIHAITHLRTWFIDDATKMNPNMNYAQAIKGICPGRGVGLIDGIHLVEPARAVSVLHEENAISTDEYKAIKKWYADFLDWMLTHEYGIDEMERKNNHGTCWVLQASEYARLTGEDDILQFCRDRYKNTLLPNQMSEDGSFHMELTRTKPYGYSLFNIDIMATVCHILSSKNNNLWTYHLADGRGMQRGMAFIYPYIADKSTWPFPQDVMYWDQWPVRHPCLIFAGHALQKPEYTDLWTQLKPLPETEEGLRNFPIREPVLWF